MDLAALVLRYPIAETTSSSIPLPVACSLVVGSQIQSIVSGSGFLEPGSYAVLPLAFNHWRPLEDIGTEERAAYVGGRAEERAASDRDCVVSVFSSRMISYDEHVMTRPGFLAESLFLLAANIKPKSQVCDIGQSSGIECCTFTFRVCTQRDFSFGLQITILIAVISLFNNNSQSTL